MNSQAFKGNTTASAGRRPALQILIGWKTEVRSITFAEATRRSWFFFRALVRQTLAFAQWVGSAELQRQIAPGRSQARYEFDSAEVKRGGFSAPQ